MTTAYGSKGTLKNLTLVKTTGDIAQASADTSYKLTVPTGWEGFIDINNSFCVVTTAIVNTTTAATIVIKKGTTTVATATCTGASAAGVVFEFEPASGYEMGVALAAADYFTLGWTQGSGGSIAGVCDAYIALELSNLDR